MPYSAGAARRRCTNLREVKSAPAPVVLVGVGEMGGVFAKALLASGHPVHPLLRGDSPAEAAAGIDPALVLVTVGESDLKPVLAGIPAEWRSSVGLIQNELLARDWEPHGIGTPTIATVWFEKKPGQDVKVILPTPIGGPSAPMLVAALERIGIPALLVEAWEKSLYEMVRKNLYILTVNIAGLETGGTVGELWDAHGDLARAVAGDVLQIQARLADVGLDDERLIAGMVEAIYADPDHKATGRSAPVRLERALGHAEEAGLSVPTLLHLGKIHLATQPPSHLAT